ncbi:MAG: lipid A biosynthesis acyltransferase, partial [Azoarcus sp.]|nr:lipid A biosynthesis acyltransferase [Azoarcus sp.]
MTRLAIFIIWLLHWLPLAVLSPLGRLLGGVFYFLAFPRRRVAATNLAACFPELDAAARRRLAMRHFQVLGRSVLERGLLWWASPERLRRIIRFEGEEHLRALKDAGTPVILLAPHFIGLDMGGARVAMSFDSVSMYAHQKRNPVLNDWLYYGRSRFGDQVLLTRQDGIRGVLKA